jgi:5-carboxymethyl-2-hydroxymuconate isomerase
MKDAGPGANAFVRALLRLGRGRSEEHLLFTVRAELVEALSFD